MDATALDLAQRLTPGQLAFLRRLHPLVGREVVTFENIFPLVRMGLVKVCPPPMGARGAAVGRECYKLTEAGALLLEQFSGPPGVGRMRA